MWLFLLKIGENKCVNYMISLQMSRPVNAMMLTCLFIHTGGMTFFFIVCFRVYWHCTCNNAYNSCVIQWECNVKCVGEQNEDVYACVRCE